MRSWKKVAVCKRVIVNTDDHSFSGVLYKQIGPLLVLKDAVMLTPSAPPTPLDGELIIERAKVAFVQVVS
jgi:hypothetical protein